MSILEHFNQGPQPHSRMTGHPEIYGILHFSLNTFTDREWGYGDESPAIFNPSNFDADQIVQSCKAGGLTGLVIVCKHHDGFCLWPSKTTPFNISASPWRNGKGDYVKEMVESCRRHGLKVGFYVSPWDRNHAEYGNPAYLEVYRAQLREVLTNYGSGYEVWFDGANGGDGYYGGKREVRKIDHATYYDWRNTWQIARDLQPQAAIFSDVGPDLRWVGNEKGFAALDASAKYTPMPNESNHDVSPGCVRWQLGTKGTPGGKYWMPAECDVPLRPGWFYHANENDFVKTLPEMLEIYFNSVGNNAFLNWGIAPDRTGQVHANDVARLKEFKAALDAIFAQPDAKTFNVIELTEDGDETESPFAVKADGKVIAQGERIGRKRLLRLDATVNAQTVTLESAAPTAKLKTYLAPAELLKKSAVDPVKALYDDSIGIKIAAATHDAVTCQLESVRDIKGFLFVPHAPAPAGTPQSYRLEYSLDGKSYETAMAGEFSNIVNNPIPVKVMLPKEIRVLFLRLTSLKNVADDPKAAIAVKELRIICH